MSNEQNASLSTQQPTESKQEIAPNVDNSQPQTPSSESLGSAELKLSFWDALPEDLKSEPSLQNFKDKQLADLAKSHVSAQKELGARIRIPGPDASKEAKDEFRKKLASVDGVVELPNNEDPSSLNAFYSKLGRPESPAHYDLKLPENIDIDQEFTAAAREVAFNAGLTQQQMQAISQLEGARAARQQAEQKTQQAQATQLLKEKWGNEFQSRQNLVGEVLHHYASKYPDAVNSLINGPAGNNPVMLLALAELGKTYREAGIIEGKRPAAFGVTPEEAQQRILEIQKNPELREAYLNPRHPKHREVVQKMADLYAIKTPGQEIN